MNLANRLTLARIILVPVFLLILSIKVKYGQYIAAGVFILAASTDGLDGYIARKRNQVTRLGKFMDPLADKLMVSAALISLVELRMISAWVAFIIIAREFAVTGLRAVVAADGVVISASWLGKIKTVSQIIAIVFLFIHDFPFNLLKLNVSIGRLAMGVAVFFTVWSGLDYFRRARHLLKTSQK
ncbi:CDP-diacylglycerol/glycerol-3-phosphate 3-phosphatidyltransferase [Thermincola ferriacetica]|uniref:CDP-diacylglycerol--glycerol-3-phosphate 3-phosphatidyltransferase n=2 Tax=Thermincola TaxID=278993 RepID=D5XF70_THEPJ|nr:MULTISPECIES: CDP-diacylglycerol--glycerol-3-phosphate 3-phosphatidyltransferase [Thermincola]ADG82291.1 CDP-diacylglycerol/glycerol-3-phosphate 3-phosphatidyltransferase [Thermincola potens JR]KNZ69364.1 CDP-diacylglycerol/glycerol-3-phosphate 3-phosphatidyltransferase [Thermincola ferriacetica]